MEIKIKKAKAGDLDNILKMSLNLFKFERSFGKTFNMNWTYSKTGQKYFTDRLKHKNALVLIAEADKEIVGYLVSFTQKYHYRSVNPIAEIDNMYVEEKSRYLGVGKLLIRELKKILRTKGVKRLKVEALAQNEQAIKFYKSVGFEEFETVLEQNLS